MEQLAEMMKDDLDRMYTTDELPAVTDLMTKDGRKKSGESEPVECFLKTKAWFWSGSLWKEQAMELREDGMVVRKAGLLAWEDMRCFAEGRTSKQNDYMAIQTLEGQMLVFWFSNVEPFRKFASVFLPLFEARPRKKLK